MDKQIVELIKKYPNDMELGKAIRDLYWKEPRKNDGPKYEGPWGKDLGLW